MKLRTKLMLSIGLLVCLSFGIMQYVNYTMAKEQTLREENEHNSLIGQIIMGSMEEQLKIGETAIITIAENRHIAELFQARNREALLELLLPVYQDLEKQGIEQFQFHVPPATSFLRLHMPERYDDDLSSFRHTVVAANNGQRVVTGLEEGRGGYGFRVVAPVSYQGQHLGTVEFGSEFNQSFLEHLQAKVDGQLYIYNFPDTQQVTWDQGNGQIPNLLAATIGEDPYLVEEALLEQAKGQGELLHTYSSDHRQSILILPFQDYTGETKGYIKAVFSREETLSQLNSLLRNAVLGSLLSILIILGVIYFLVNSLTRPLNTLVEVLEDIANAKGDLTRRIEIASGDETEKLANATNSMLASLQGTLKSILAVAQKLTSSTEQVDKAVEEVNASMGEITLGVNSVARGSSENAIILGEVNQGSMQVAKSAESTAVAAQEASEFSTLVVNSAQETLSFINKVDNIAKDLDDSRQEMTQLIGNLDSSTQSISQIINTITAIADQTNLLALNASIEAARAGEHGRGFAVVAEEVRKLAEEATGATKEIDLLIKENQQRLAGVVRASQATNDNIHNVVDHVTMSKEKVSAIAEYITKINNQIQEMAAVSQEQSALSEEMTASVNSIGKVVDESAASAQEIAAQVEEQSSFLEEIGATMDELNNLAHDLQDRIGGFKL